MANAQAIAHSTQSDTLADVLERVLNVGVVIVGDIRINLCDVELLSIQIRLLICSVEKAQELGIPWWWEQSPSSNGSASKPPESPQQAVPEAESQARTPWEEYRKFQEFQRFQEAMRSFEEAPR